MRGPSRAATKTDRDAQVDFGDTRRMGRRAYRGAIVACWILATSCGPSGAQLLVDLRTDLAPAAEFAQVELVLVPDGSSVGRTISHTATSAEDPLRAMAELLTDVSKRKTSRSRFGGRSLSRSPR